MGVESLLARRRRQMDKSVLAGQHQIEHDEVDGLAGQQAVERLGVFGQQHLEAFLGQVAAQQVADASVVIDDRNPVGTGVRCVGHRASYL